MLNGDGNVTRPVRELLGPLPGEISWIASQRTVSTIVGIARRFDKASQQQSFVIGRSDHSVHRNIFVLLRKKFSCEENVRKIAI